MSILSVSVMHAPWDSKRVEWLKTIAERVNTPTLNVVSDDNKEGVWATAKKAWKLSGTRIIKDKNTQQDVTFQSTHHIVFQDDMIPEIGWEDKLLTVIEKHPDAVISAFQPANYTLAQRYHLNKAPLYDYKGALWGGSFAMPMQHALAVGDWCDINAKNIDDSVDDLKITLYCKAHNTKILHMYPSLFEHVGYDSSLINHGNGLFRKGDGSFLNKV